MVELTTSLRGASEELTLEPLQLPFGGIGLFAEVGNSCAQLRILLLQTFYQGARSCQPARKSDPQGVNIPHRITSRIRSNANHGVITRAGGILRRDAGGGRVEAHAGNGRLSRQGWSALGDAERRFQAGTHVEQEGFFEEPRPQRDAVRDFEGLLGLRRATEIEAPFGQ